MISIALKNQNNKIINGKIDHEKESLPFFISEDNMAVLGIKEYHYQKGDFLEITCDETPCYIYAQLEETLSPTLLYLPDRTWKFYPLLEDQERKASVDTSFSSSRHCIFVRKAFMHEIKNYQNLSFNSHDQKEFYGVFPHATANVETRNEAVFFAKNAVDGKYANQSHGSYPFTSWGINQQSDAELTIDFGRKVEIDWVRVLFRGDFPHDSYWTSVTIEFSNGNEKIFNTTNSLLFQDFHFDKTITTYIKIKNLIKANDLSPFPALTQIEVYGKNCL